MDVINIYAGIDTILDIRVGALVTLYGDVHPVVKDLMGADFRRRNNDNFHEMLPYVDKEKYLALIAEQSIDVLKNSVMTAVLTQIQEIGTMIERKNVAVPLIQEYCLHLDIDKYAMTEDEKGELESVLVELLPAFNFKLISLGLKHLTPAHISAVYDVVFLYDSSYWLGVHSPELAKLPIPEVYLFIPALFHDRVPSDEETVVERIGATQPFELIERILVEFINVQILDVMHFTFLDLNE